MIIIFSTITSLLVLQQLAYLTPIAATLVTAGLLFTLIW